MDIYYDLSYGRKPQVLLIIDIPPDIHHILQVRSYKNELFHRYELSFLICSYYIIQNPVRWLTPKAPSFKINENTLPLLDALMKYFLPMGLSIEQRETERQSIHRFIRELNQIRRNHVDRDFASSYVVNNVTALGESYPFVSVHQIYEIHITKRFSTFPFLPSTFSASYLRGV